MCAGVNDECAGGRRSTGPRTVQNRPELLPGGGLEVLFVQLLCIQQNKVDETQCEDFGPEVPFLSFQTKNTIFYLSEFQKDLKSKSDNKDENTE